MRKTYISIYVPELQDNFQALWNNQEQPNQGDIIKVQNPLYGNITYYAEILSVCKEDYQMKARDFMCV